MLKKILIGLGAVIAVFVVVVALQPSHFHLERKITVAAPAATVFAHVDDFHAWRAWSPWEKLDPEMKRTFEGPAAGVGAIYGWSGDDKVGKGRMTIEKSEKPSLLVIRLEFLEPWEATSASTFSFASVAGGTQVTWSMEGENGFLSKAVCLFMDMDAMVGPDFERGLADLKTVAESAPKPAR